jgi:hypothetical protein
VRAATGQALRWLQRLIRLLIPLALLASLALGVLAWRLAEGPLPLPVLARQIEQAVNAEGGLRLEIGAAAIAWEGWRSGAAAPMDIRLDAVRLRDAEGRLRAHLPDVAVTLSIRALLQGRLAPATVELRRPSLLVSRAADGSISLGAGRGAPEEPATTEFGGGTPIAGLLEELHRSSAEGGTRTLSSFRRLRIQGGEVLVQDLQLNRRWSLAGTAIEIRRSPRGSLAAEGSATAESIGITVPVRITASMPAEEPPRLTVDLVLPALQPAELAGLWPELAPLRILDARVTLGATGQFDASGGPARVQARLLAGEGALDFGEGRRLPVLGLGASLEGQEGLLRLTAATLRLPGPTRPTLQARGVATRGPEGWTAELDLDLASLSMAALPALWPAGLGDAARGPTLAMLAAGMLRDLHLGVSIAAGPEFTDLRLREARARFAMDQADLAVGAGFAATGAQGLAPSARVAADRIALAARLTPEALTVEEVVVQLPVTAPGVPATTLSLAAEATREAATGAWQGVATLALDTVRFADLPRFWPEGLAQNAREWVTGNITAGVVRDGRWRVELAMPPGAEGPAVTALSGTAELADATVHWLRPLPPILGLSGSASFSLPEITIRTRGGQQMVAPLPAPRAEASRSGRGTQRSARPAPPRPAGIETREASIRLFDLESPVSRADIDVQLGGPLPEVMTLLRHPRLRLFEKKPLEINALAGQAEARLSVGLPLLDDLQTEQMRLRATGRVAEARLTEVLMGHELERGAFEFTVDLDGLRLSGQGVMEEAPLRATVELDFRSGPPGQVTERAQVTVPRADARQLAAFGFDTGGLMGGTAAVEVRYERRRNGQGSVALRGDLRDTRLTFEAAGWAKAAGAPGAAEATLRLTGDQLTAAEGLRIDTAGLVATGRIGFAPGNRLNRVEIAAGSRLGATRFGGTVTRPAREGGPWGIALRGPLVDLQPMLSPPEAVVEATRQGPRDAASAGPQFALDLRFDRATTGEGRNLEAVTLQAEVDGRGMLRSAQMAGRTGPAGAFDLGITPRGTERHLRLTAADGGALLQALDLTDAIAGGRLSVNAVYRELRPGAPLSGTAELDDFAVRNAPGLGKVLQAMTLYGLVEAMQGGNGLVFTRLVAPFTLTREAITLEDARAFSASLGLTAKGRVLRERDLLEIEGTVVPAYFFNQLLGNIPLLGRLFSPERGGGVFAATYQVQGPRTDPTVSVNPLAALTPGFLRGLFKLPEAGGAAGR